MGRTRIRDVRTDGRTSGLKPGDYFSGSIKTLANIETLGCKNKNKTQTFVTIKKPRLTQNKLL